MPRVARARLPRARVILSLGTAALLTVAATSCAQKSTADKASAVSGSASTSCGTNAPGLYKSGQLTVATDSPAYAPWFDNNDPSDGKGFESAVAYAVATQLGFTKDQVKWVVEPFNSSYAPGAKNFDFDINEISITADRAKAVDFSTGYYTANQGIVVLDSSKYANATSLADLKSAKIGVQVATTSYEAVGNVIKPTQQPAVFNGTDDAAHALKNKQVDAIITDLPTAFYISGAQIDGSKVLGQFDYTGTAADQEQFGLLLKKGSALTPCVDGAIAALKSSGELQKITDQWLSQSVNAPKLG
ncbi:ABC transporter substrate-binding protein [Actinocrinis sp.]|uniref:ABC transporter substrate-binding protein n=1 Tax=Actinocrinis sp. TaxID=1920516 RepID=UPI002D243395|nr:ABC transporter substrate-binding protein [Actinocrinis sp.]HZP52917.1 ABC transporter substrate-binding protein [Actinocrinis sp.]